MVIFPMFDHFCKPEGVTKVEWKMCKNPKWGFNTFFLGEDQSKWEKKFYFIVGFILPRKCSIKVVFENIGSKYGYL